MNNKHSVNEHYGYSNIEGVYQMEDIRDMTQLSMMSKTEWTDEELSYFHHSLQQIAPYLNSEGQTIHREIIEEITHRG